MSAFHSQIPVHEVNLGAGISAFFTQTSGGISPAPWASLNLGTNVQDQRERVLENRAIVGQRLGKPVRFATQMHANNVLSPGPLRTPGEVTIGVADALVTRATEFGLGVLVADCVPILLADPESGVIAVAHAGRAGLQNGVINNVVEELKRIGALTTQIRAAVGPAICARCYEVPSSMAQEFQRVTQIAPAQTIWGTPGLDLRAAADVQLRQKGVGNIAHVPHCTFEEKAYFSHRRASKSGHTTGRFAGIIGLDRPSRE